MPQVLPDINIETRGTAKLVVLSGEWTLFLLAPMEDKISSIATGLKGKVTLETAGIVKIDTAGTSLLCRLVASLVEQNVNLELSDATEKIIASGKQRCIASPDIPYAKVYPAYIVTLNEIGKAIIGRFQHFIEVIGFTGWVLVLSGKSLIRPWRLRWTPIVYHMEQVGLRAVPIVSLLTFLIGLVVMYMGAQQLERFGAEVLSVNLLEVASLRELAPMLTAIVVAGRSGSAFTAQIGSMVANEELSAMRVMGLEPMELLVLPRVIALLVMLPILTVVADFASVMGGAVAAWLIMDMDFATFIIQFHNVVNLNNFFTGLVKTPFFAVSVAIIGCYYGHMVTGSASSVGERTTQSVVESIFVVIVLDAAFALVFSALQI